MLTVESLTKGFGNRRVLTDVSFSIDGGVCGLLGPNGAGKTTLLSIVGT